MNQLLGPDGQPITSTREPRRNVASIKREYHAIKARYDAAQDTTQNRDHWACADHRGPDAANDPQVRLKLRSRSRYELIENNPYLKGSVLTLTNDFVGSGPKLNITDQKFSLEQQQQIATRWQEWSAAAFLRNKLWRMKLAKITDGETFGILSRNPRMEHPLQLDMTLLEAEQVSSLGIVPKPSEKNIFEVDGIRFDKWSNPIQYSILFSHPGEVYGAGQYIPQLYGGDWINSKFVIHWYRKDRGWHRGIPEITPSLPLCALLRRYTLAVVQSAEIAADFSAVLQTDGPPNQTAYGDVTGMTQDEIEANFFDSFPVMRGMVTALPFNSSLSQLKAEQPTTVYDAFVDSILREIVRPLLIPFNVASGFSGGYNFASGTLDKQIYWGGQKAERQDCEEVVLEHLFRMWWREGALIPGYFNQDVIPSDQPINRETNIPKHTWGWDVEPDHPDPQKVATALETLWQNGFISDKDVQEMRFNRNVEDHYENLREQQQFRTKEDLPVPGNGAQNPNQQQNFPEE